MNDRAITKTYRREDGSEVIVTVWLHEGMIEAVEVAERDHHGDTWGPPLGEVVR